MSAGLRAILVTGSAAQGGAERQTATLCRRLAEHGHDCLQVHVKDAAAADGGSQTLGAARYLDWRAVRRLRAEIAHAAPHVILAANPYALLYAALARAGAARRPALVVTYHTTQLPSLKEQLQTLAYRPLFWSADCAVFVCHEQERYCRRRAVLSRRNIVIHNGVDTDFYSNRQTTSDVVALRRSLGFGAADNLIGISAWLRPEKNHVQHVDALALLRHRGIRAGLVAIGDGETRGAVLRRARQLGLEDRVTVTGAQTDVRPYVAACDAMAICSTAVETFSLAALEAMAMGKPVVHSAVGGAAEMIKDGDNGFVFATGDTAALAACLAVLADPARAQRMGARARAVAAAQFSEGTMVERYETLLDELTRAQSVRAGGARRARHA